MSFSKKHLGQKLGPKLGHEILSIELPPKFPENLTMFPENRIVSPGKDSRLVALGPAGQLPERIGVVGRERRRRGGVLHGGGDGALKVRGDMGQNSGGDS